MRVLRQFAVLILMLAIAHGVRAGEVIDRIVAVVGKHAILESDLDEAVRFEAFAASRPLASVTAADVKSTLDRLIDQQLIRDEVGVADTFAARDEDVKKNIVEIRSQSAGPASDEVWRSAMSAYGLNEDVVRDHVRQQLEMMRMVNQALRPNIRIEQAEVEAYYREQFLPKLRQTGASEVSLASVSSRIRQILVEQRIGESLEGWLKTLRSQSDVRIELTEEEDPVGTKASAAQQGSAGDRFVNLR